MNHIIALMAHVDAGKTTLSESILLLSGGLRKAGSVDRGTTALDTDPVEQARGITIYAAQADFSYAGQNFTLIDTPGHADFAAEACRSLPILDSALLLLDGTGGSCAHFAALYKQLDAASVPSLMLVTKADRPLFHMENTVRKAQNRLGIPVIPVLPRVIDEMDETLIDALSALDDHLLEDYLNMSLTPASVWAAVKRIFKARSALFAVPVSGLTGQNVDELLTLLAKIMPERIFSVEGLDAPVYEVRTDDRGQRVCFVRMMRGTLRPKDELTFGDEKYKINEIRAYTGARYRLTPEALPGQAVGLVGIPARIGDAIQWDNGIRRVHPGTSSSAFSASMRALIRPKDPSKRSDLSRALYLMSTEDPLLNAVPDSDKGVLVCIAGPVHLEVLCQTLHMRFGIQVVSDPPKVLYRETVAAPVRGYGHYEPLRHYAEVQLGLIPAPPGSGICFKSAVPVDELALNWQRLIETHVMEISHPGFLTGAPLTDVCVVLLTGRAHLKHTEGGDFRQATYRAIRQALFHANCVLLEPWVQFEIALPYALAGRAISDIQRLNGKTDGQETLSDGTALIYGSGPLSTLMDYPLTLAQYTHGEGAMTTKSALPRPCHNALEVIAQTGYDASADTEHPAWSVFCAKGAGYAVPWAEVPSAVHTQVSDERLASVGLK